MGRRGIALAADDPRGKVAVCGLRQITHSAKIAFATYENLLAGPFLQVINCQLAKMNFYCFHRGYTFMSNI